MPFVLANMIAFSFDGLLDSPLLFPAEQAQLKEALTNAETRLRLEKEREQAWREKEADAEGEGRQGGEVREAAA